MILDFKNKDKYNVDDLIEIVKRLRAPDGCPWDKVQTHKSIRKDFIEEVYEAVEAIDEDDVPHLREELGDVLFQVVFHSVIESENGNFDFSDITDEVSRKMILRHPHVFGEIEVETTEQVLSNWDAIKMQTHSQTTVSETMESVSKTLPSLMRAEKLVKKSARGGVECSDKDEAFELIEEKLARLKNVSEKDDAAANEKAMGELLFSIANLSGLLKTDSEQSLYNACEDHIARFRRYEDIAAEKGLNIQDSDTEVTNQLWKEIINQEKLEEKKNEQI